MSDPIRAALERLVELEDKRWGTSTWDDAVAAARAALAEQQGDEAQVSLFVDSHIDPEHQGEDRQILHVFYDACMSEGGTADEIHLRGLRAVLSRWGHQPAPPAEGEVAELVELLHKEAADDEIGDHMLWMTPADARRAAELLQQQHPTPVPVSEGLPEPSVKVLAHYFNDLGKGRTICAIWVPAKTRSDSYGDDDFTEYDEESDTFYWPEGWYEAIENWDDLGYVKVDEGEVIYWQPLPKWPAHALPLPQGEAQQ